MNAIPRPILVSPRCIRYRPGDIQVGLDERARARRHLAPKTNNPAPRA